MYKYKYIIGNSDMISSKIFFNYNIFNVFIIFIWFNVIDIIPYFVALYCNVTVTLVQHFVISNGPIYGVSYLTSPLSLRMKLYPTL